MSKQTKTPTSNAPMPYFSMHSNSEEQSAEIYIFGDIAQEKGGLSGLFQASSDQSSYDLANQIARIPEDWAITVHINSNGGQLKEGLGIYNVLKTRDVTTINEGFAASAGSVIFAAGKRRIMQPASLLFIHQASMCADGNSDDFRKAAEDLRVVTDAAVAAYRESGITIESEELYSMLKAETWITPEDAVKMGFATAIADAPRDDEEGVIYNDAMRSIMNAVTRKPEPEPASPDLAMAEQIAEMYGVFKTVTAAAEEHPVGLKAIVDTWLSKFTTEPTPNPAQVEHKGFFNFKTPENGKGGKS